jgi:hypothetical protein
MNDTEKRIAIAEACGWKQITLSDWEAPDGMRHQNWGGLISCPDYLNDLNAMHEAEKALGDKQRMTYYAILVSIVRKSLGIDPYESHYQPKFTTHATARQRADAFIKTLGLDKL